MKSSSEQSGFYGSDSASSDTELDSDVEAKKPATPEALPITAPTAPPLTAWYLQPDVVVTPPAKPPIAAEQTPSAVRQEKGGIGSQTCCGAGWYLKNHLLYYATPQTNVIWKILEGLPFSFFSPGPADDAHLVEYRRAKLMEQLAQKQLALLEILDRFAKVFLLCWFFDFLVCLMVAGTPLFYQHNPSPNPPA